MAEKSYTHLAQFYDKFMYDCDYDKWSQYLYALIKKFGSVDGSGVDAACGSGKMTQLLHYLGLDIYGFDLSEQMLNQATQNTGINFIKADMKKFKAHKKLDFLNCSCDGINYISHDDTVKVFSNFYNNLKSGGLLLFDISSSSKLKNTISNNTFYNEKDNVCYVWNNFLDQKAQTVEMELIFFIKQNNCYNRFDEYHLQYIHDDKIILAQLEQVGFKKAFAYNFLSQDHYQNQCDRVQFVAIK